MSKPTLKSMLTRAKEQGYAVGAFNIFNYLSARAVILAAEELESCAIIQTSVSTVKRFGILELIKMLKGLVEMSSQHILIHLDHCTDAEFAKKCIDAGWDSVMIDASAKPLEENISITAGIKKYAAKTGVSVEGELGVIKGVEDDLVSDESIEANYEESIRYLNETGIDAFAPAVGTAHGLYKGTPKINYTLVEELSRTSSCPVVIHGGTGLSESAFKKLIDCGATKINVSTALKESYIGSLKEYVRLHGDEVNPLKADQYAEDNLKKVIKEHIVLFNSQGTGCPGEK